MQIVYYNKKWPELLFSAKTFLILHFSIAFWWSVITCFAVISRITSFTITAIACLKIDTRGFVLAWTVRAMVCNSREVRNISLNAYLMHSFAMVTCAMTFLLLLTVLLNSYLGSPSFFHLGLMGFPKNSGYKSLLPHL